MKSFTNKQVYKIYMSQDDYSKDDKASSTVTILEEMCVEANVDWDLNAKRYNRVRKVKALVDYHQNYVRKKMSPSEIEVWENSVFVILKPLDTQAPMEVDGESDCKRGRPKKVLSENPGSKTTNKILDSILNNLNCVADEQNISTGMLLRMLTDRWVEQNSKESPIKSKSDMPVLTACSMLFNLNLSLNQYQELRLELLPHGFSLPVRNDVDVCKKNLLPQSVFSEPVKASCDVLELIPQTVGSLLTVNNISPTGNLKVIAKFGLDGSGSHKIRHQVVGGDEIEISNEDESSYHSSEEEEEEEKETKSYLGGFWCPLHIYDCDRLLWTNPFPNSILYARPVCLVREKETRESVAEHFKPYMDQLEQLQNGFVQIKEELSARIMTELSMMDGKMVDLVQGDSGAFCHYCNATRAEANDLTKIKTGFVIEKTAKKCSEIWELLDAEEMNYGDKQRKGQVHKPLNTQNIRFYGITHQKLRSLDHMEKLLYHLVSGQTHTWSEENHRVKDALKLAKKETIEHIRKSLGFLIDTPTSGGGNTDTGGIAERFFSPESREKICSLILNKTHRAAYSKLLQLYNVVLTVCQNVDPSKIAIPSKVNDLCIELMVFEKTNFPWAMLSPSVHSMCGHNPELFDITKGAPIAIFSEQGSEAWNKFIRSFKSGAAARARQTSIQENILDIFNRMMIKTHPQVASRKRQYKCSRCNKMGHTVKSCPMSVTCVWTLEKSRVESCFE